MSGSARPRLGSSAGLPADGLADGRRPGVAGGWVVKVGRVIGDRKADHRAGNDPADRRIDARDRGRRASTDIDGVVGRGRRRVGARGLGRLGAARDPVAYRPGAVGGRGARRGDLVVASGRRGEPDSHVLRAPGGVNDGWGGASWAPSCRSASAVGQSKPAHVPKRWVQSAGCRRRSEDDRATTHNQKDTYT